MAQGGSAGAAKNVVLVHGAFADDSSWSKIVPLLKAKGFRVTTAGNPLTSFADDVAATKRAIAEQDGPTVLVGHSYGGVVITEAGNDPKVVSLVYVASSNDRMIDPEQEKSMAKQIKAKATVLPSSHVAMLSHPAEVAKVIEEAAANGHRP